MDKHIEAEPNELEQLRAQNTKARHSELCIGGNKGPCNCGAEATTASASGHMPEELKEAIRDYRHCTLRELKAHMDMIERIYLNRTTASSAGAPKET